MMVIVLSANVANDRNQPSELCYLMYVKQEIKSEF